MVNLQGKRRSTKDYVVDYVLDCVLAKELLPGGRIVETKIAKTLGFSQGVIREAFKDLSFMGFLITEPYKGTYIRDFSISQRDDYYDVRTFIEKTAVRWGYREGIPEM